MSVRNRFARLIVLIAIILAFGLDIFVKRLMLTNAASWNDEIIVPGLLDTHFTFNRGVSFNLFWQNTDLGSEALAGLQMILILVLGLLAVRTQNSLRAAGLGLIIGGALGNIVDRLGIGAVFDFLVVHIGKVPFFVCNSADLFISVGVIVLGFDLLFAKKSKKACAPFDQGSI